MVEKTTIVKKRMEKIAFTGTHGTGKTTLAHELVAALKKRDINAEFLGEIARTCPLPINEDTSKEAQEWIIYTQYVKELEHINRCAVLVCDRSVLDSYAYYINKFGENNLLEGFIKEKIKDYSFLFRVPINAEYLKEDGIRSVNYSFQKSIDEKVKYLLNKFSVNYHTESNIDKIMEVINDRRTI